MDQVVYSDIFKSQLTKRILDDKESIRGVARDARVSISALREWVKDAKSQRFADRQAEIAAKNEEAEVREETGEGWTSRDQEMREMDDTREDEEIDFDSMFHPTQSLAAPAPREGFVQRWVRMQTGNEHDAQNMMRRQQTGRWTPRDPSTIKENFFLQHAKQGDMIVIRGMVLMERPQKIHDAAKKWKKQRIADQMTRVETDIRDSQFAQGGMRPFVSPETRSTVQRGKPVRVAED